MRAVMISCLVAVFFGSAAAESTVQRFSCIFEQRVSPDGGPTSSEPLTIEFVVDGTGHAFAVGRNMYPVRLVVGDQGITFLEELVTGAVQTTTIHKNGGAVHSRHTMFSIIGKITPSQYYGMCE